MSAPKLTACPFCGNQDIYVIHNEASDYVRDWYHSAHCPGCGIEGPHATGYDEAVAAWNRRAQPAEEVQRDALKEADALISRIEAFYDGADMFAWAKVREKVRAALAAKDKP